MLKSPNLYLISGMSCITYYMADYALVHRKNLPGTYLMLYCWVNNSDQGYLSLCADITVVQEYGLAQVQQSQVSWVQIWVLWGHFVYYILQRFVVFVDFFVVLMMSGYYLITFKFCWNIFKDSLSVATIILNFNRTLLQSYHKLKILQQMKS